MALEWKYIEDGNIKITNKAPGAGYAPDKETEMKIRAELEAKWALEKEAKEHRRKLKKEEKEAQKAS